MDSTNSEEYYRTIRSFTDEVVAEASTSLQPGVESFMEYIREFRLEELRTREEYLFELLSFGLLWKVYGGYSRAVRRAPFVTMARMAEWRKTHPEWKPAIDIARGILATLFLLPKKGQRDVPLPPTLAEVDRLCLWLEATGEFREQALRFVRWRAYWEVTGEDRFLAARASVFKFVGWFESRATAVLGKHTGNVEDFLKATRKRYRWREDRIQCSRTRAEYHLNMVGAELMNRSFQADFRNTEATAFLLPGCMRGRPPEECQAERLPEGLRCTGCLPSCRVNQIRVRGNRNHAEVYIIPHASDLRRWSPKPDEPRRGVVAAACVTNLVEGGWELKRYDVPAQCVLLDFSGCSKHWHPGGLPTSLNVRELDRVMSA